MSDELKPGEGGQTPNLDAGDDAEISEDTLDAIFGDHDLDTDQKKELAKNFREKELEQFNKASGKNFKTWSQAIKSMKEAEKRLTDVGRKPKEDEKDEVTDKRPTPVAGETKISPVIKNLYFGQFPEAAEIWSEVEEAAKNTNKDPFELYESSTYFKGEAKARYEIKRSENEARNRVETPSNLISGGAIAFDKIDLKNPEHLKWLKTKPERRTQYNEWILKDSLKR